MVEITENKIFSLKKSIITAFDSNDYEKIGLEYSSYSNSVKILAYYIEELVKGKFMDLIDSGSIEKEI